MKLYIIRAWNDVGGGIGTYYVVAPGVNKAKAAIRKSDPIIKKVEVIEERKVMDRIEIEGEIITIYLL